MLPDERVSLSGSSCGYGTRIKQRDALRGEPKCMQGYKNARDTSRRDREPRSFKSDERPSALGPHQHDPASVGLILDRSLAESGVGLDAKYL